jgi:hypothetical protein
MPMNVTAATAAVTALRMDFNMVSAPERLFGVVAIQPELPAAGR